MTSGYVRWWLRPAGWIVGVVLLLWAPETHGDGVAALVVTAMLAGGAALAPRVSWRADPASPLRAPLRSKWGYAAYAGVFVGFSALAALWFFADYHLGENAARARGGPCGCGMSPAVLVVPFLAGGLTLAVYGALHAFDSFRYDRREARSRDVPTPATRDSGAVAATSAGPE